MAVLDTVAQADAEALTKPRALLGYHEVSGPQGRTGSIAEHKEGTTRQPWTETS